MHESSPSPGAFELLKDLLLEVAQAGTLDVLLPLIVRRLCEQGNVAVARIWLIAPGDSCGRCAHREVCPARAECLHLVASAVHPRQGEILLAPRPDSPFRRIPLGAFKVGRVAESRQAVIVTDPLHDPQIKHPEFIAREGVRGFIGQPLICRDELLGVLGVFLRVPVTQQTADILRVLANHAAAAIVSARAFAALEQMKQRLWIENQQLRVTARESELARLVGGSTGMQRVLRDIEAVAPTAASVLISGESGTGKELVARAIHQASQRSEGPFIELNCAAIARELSESELFGHVRGAFSGAIRDRVGRFESAHGGTLFLDEIGELPLELQGKLLRVLQEGRFERVGEARTRSVDVRVVAATNRDLHHEIEAGRFRHDLYYRLNVFPIDVPPLRERKEDIEPLSLHLLAEICRRMQRPPLQPSPADLERLQQHDWPGNVRELQNALERSVIAARGGALRLVLPERRRRERDNIEAALAACGGRIYGKDGAAVRLGVPPTTLMSRIERMNLRARRVPE
jgi:transcriptional regulator with GAF, ATPase, and Fis domain